MKSDSRALLACTLCFLLSFNLALFAQSSQVAGAKEATESRAATVPPFFTYGGTLADSAGKPVTGVVGVTFSLYADQQGGAPLWMDTQNVQLDNDGRFGIVLGTVGKSLPLDLFSVGQPRWLGVQTQNSAEQSRMLLASVPYALTAGNADTLGGKPASAYLLRSEREGASHAGDDALPQSAVLAKSYDSETATGAQSPQTLLAYQPVVLICPGPCALSSYTIFQDGGNVGIGTAKAFGKLQTRMGPDINLAIDIGNDHTAARLDAFNDTATANIPLEIQGRTVTLYGGGGALGLAVNSSGNVGVGTLNPTARLDVNGTVKATAFVGDGAGLTNLPGGTATDVNCAATCISTGEIFDGAVTSVKIADGTIVDADINAAAGIAPTKIAGTAATLGVNNFTATQSITGGNLGLPNTVGISGVITFGGSRFFHNFGTENAFLGKNAGNFTTTGIRNTAMGENALETNTTGDNNTANGVGALYQNTTGSGNTALGVNAGGYFIGPNSNTTGSNNTFLGVSSGPGTATQLNNATAIGANALVSADNTLVLGDSSVSVAIGATTAATKLQVVGDIRVGINGTNGCIQGFGGAPLAGTCSSDERLKKNIEPFSVKLDDVVQLTPVSYDWQADEHPEYHFGSARSSGLIAQEVEKVFPDMVVTDERGYKAVNYSQLPLLLLQAMKDLKAQSDSRESRLAETVREQQSQIQELLTAVRTLGARLENRESK